MKNILMKTMGLVLALVVVLGLCIGGQPVSAEDDLVQLDLTFDYAPEPGKGHTWVGGSGPSTPLEQTMVDSWEKLPIKVTDSEGNVYEVPREYHFGRGTNYLKDGGKYKEGEELTIEVDPSGLPDGYHVSWHGDDSYHKVEYLAGYYKMKYTIHKANMNAKLFYIPIGKMTTKFYMMGGTSTSGDSPVIRVVNKDNSVDFPAEPTKENLHFGGWFTRSGDHHRIWTAEDSFSDLNRDWWQYNDVRIDPLYDGFFVLRAQWNAHVTFDSDGGSPVETAVVEEGTRVSYPAMPTKKGASFLYWQDENGDPYDWSKPVTKDMKLKAIWQEEPEDSDMVNITFNASGGKWPDNDPVKVVQAKKGDDVALLAAPVREGYTFQFWRGEAYLPGDTYKVEPGHTFVAVWASNTPANPCDDSKTPPVNPGNNSQYPEIPLQPQGQSDTQRVVKKTLPPTGEVASSSYYALALLVIAGGALVLKRKGKTEQ